MASRLVGLPDSPAAQGVTYALVAAISVAVAIWGYRWLVRCTTIIAVLGGLLLVLMPFAFGGAIKWDYAGGEYLLGTFWATWLLVAATIGVAGSLIVSTILGDWTRYIRSDLHPRAAWCRSRRRAVPGLRGAGLAGAIVATRSATVSPVTVTWPRGRPGTRSCCSLSRSGGVGLVAQSLYSAVWTWTHWCSAHRARRR